MFGCLMIARSENHGHLRSNGLRMFEEIDVGFSFKVVSKVSQDNEQSCFRAGCNLLEKTLSNGLQKFVFLRKIGDDTPITKDNYFRCLALRFGRSKTTFVYLISPIIFN